LDLQKQKALENALSSYKRKGIHRFSDEFKKMAVNMLQNGLKPSQVAKIVGTNSTNIYDWKKRYS
jgi:transposase-like protein